MGRSSLVPCAVLGLCVAACGSAAPTVDDAPAARAAPAADAASDAAPLRHAASGMVFPAHLAGLERDAAAMSDALGDDILVGYHRVDDDVALSATVAVYPASGTLERDFATAVSAILEQRPGATLIAEGQVAIEQMGLVHEGRRAHFLVRDPTGRTPPSISHLFLFQHGPWRLKYRATALARQHVETDLALIRFMRALAWPELAVGDVALLAPEALRRADRPAP